MITAALVLLALAHPPLAVLVIGVAAI